MNDKSKAVLWNIPIVGLIYFTICLFNIKWWFGKYVMLGIIGAGIQCISITIVAALIKIWIN